MNRNDFLEIMDNRKPFDPGMLGEFNELIRIFPYFQSAHLLFLKGLNRNEDVRFGNQLRNSALYIADREVLYDLLATPVTDHVKTDEPVPAPEAETPVNIIVTPEDISVSVSPDNGVVAELPVVSLNIEAETADTTIEPQDLSGSDTEKEQTVIDIAKNSDEIISEIEKETELPGENNDSIDYEETPTVVIAGEEEIAVETAVQAAAEEEIDLLELETDKGNYTDEAPVKEETRLTQADLIERFIILNPRIEPNREKREEPVEDRSVPAYDESGFVTETLARIYIGQGYYSKAIDIFEKLTLKFPEKSSYFAAQIEKVKEYLKK
jgi:hypothetical protein